MVVEYYISYTVRFRHLLLVEFPVPQPCGWCQQFLGSVSSSSQDIVPRYRSGCHPDQDQVTRRTFRARSLWRAKQNRRKDSETEKIRKKPN
ncbi:unnamed protein product [Macrosiphum euphorbiae]|uniref:Uncharacterized protein n=1 Tax=Macrosiphum euphorbiae TaxID=13131 RepID=A0AAV0WRQ1_9HEMI|nr:unnamed protein product [Macrosiphum euphorbiae]